MTTAKKLEFIKDVANKKITVIRFFDAPAAQVWRAWTEKEILDQWWAPKPWKTNTEAMDFRVNGSWVYTMNGPEGEKHWCKADYTAISAPKSFSITEYFCDEKSNKNTDLPTMRWDVSFQPEGDITRVTVVINFDSEADLETITNMGFQEGFTSAMENLDAIYSVPTK